jgi:protein involved in polysaccharide export with SLBB domain
MRRRGRAEYHYNVRLCYRQGIRKVIGELAARKYRPVFATAIVLIALALSAVVAHAQQSGGGDTGQELQLFNSLSPDQQQSIMQRLGQQGDQGTSTSGLSGLNGLQGLSGSSYSSSVGNQNSSQSVLQQQLGLQQQRRLKERMQDQNGSNDLFTYQLPVFKPGDTVLVEINILQEAGRSQSPPAAQPATMGPNPNSQLYSNLPGNQPLQSANGISVQEQPQKTVEELQADEKERIQQMIGHIRLGNPYEIDTEGELQLPGIPAFKIAGLNEEQATRLLSADIAFEKTGITLYRLPVDKSGQAALKPFGYDLFENSMVGLLPMLNLPVPSDYVVGPGDILQVQLFGSNNQMLKLPVQRNGEVNFPQLGPIQVAGLHYSAMQSEIEGRVNKQLVGTHASITMGEVRTISVFVTGSAAYPGSYTVSSLATVTTALFAAGGVKEKGSLRDIEVKRQGTTIRRFDLYDLLMRGDSSNDVKLESGDVVFIPPVGPTASVDGEVQRPAIYELKGQQSVADLLLMAGGLTPDADATRAALVRVGPDERRVVLEVSPSVPSTTDLGVRNGDFLQIARLRPQLDSGVTVHGHVYRQKYVAWHEGMRLTEAVPSAEDLQPGADQDICPDSPRSVAQSARHTAVGRSCGGAGGPRLTSRYSAIATGLDHGVRLGDQPSVDHPFDDERAAAAVGCRGAYAHRPYRWAGQSAGRLPARTRHACERPFARRGRSQSGRLCQQG